MAQLLRDTCPELRGERGAGGDGAQSRQAGGEEQCPSLLPRRPIVSHGAQDPERVLRTARSPEPPSSRDAQRMVIIDSILLGALCQSQHAAVDPDSKAPSAQAPRIDGQGAAASVGGDPPSHPRRASKRAPSHPFLAAVDCAPHDVPVQSVKPGQPRRLLFSPSGEHARASSGCDRNRCQRPDIRTHEGMKFKGSPRCFSDVLSLHYRDKIPSRPSILFIPNAASCNTAVAYISYLSIQRPSIEAPYLPAAVVQARGHAAQVSATPDSEAVHREAAAPNSRSFLPPAARSTSLVRSTRRAAASSPRGGKGSATCAQTDGSHCGRSRSAWCWRALSRRSSPRHPGERVAARSHVVCAPVAVIKSFQPPTLVQDGTEARSPPPPSTPPASPRACGPSSS
ncbi:hypothetical protein AURDEDRAFT_177830 [Auricularia subglabra TFB-10046 SS5]|uniref:Uncharacterized protein n=1 Tax=Auricularia subglabra (strain TFB-10046 / SS5) TaxID=717982 RepID=J0WMP1_AURST|nr:hypothetical protein AURDEDRAFT_177830 [Auricularia subglabra TFB-10046 SS5]